MKKLYEAVVSAKGGRNGNIKSDDGLLELKLAFPKEMGGNSQGTNPEQLFGAAYASCYEQALIHMAQVHNIKLEGTEVIAKVSVLQDESGSFNLAVELDIKLEGCDKSDKLIKLAHAACPYAKAVKGNIPVELKLI